MKIYTYIRKFLEKHALYSLGDVKLMEYLAPDLDRYYVEICDLLHEHPNSAIRYVDGHNVYYFKLKDHQVIEASSGYPIWTMKHCRHYITYAEGDIKRCRYCQKIM